jgi:hypothetical protein
MTQLPTQVYTLAKVLCKRYVDVFDGFAWVPARLTCPFFVYILRNLLPLCLCSVFFGLPSFQE